MAKSNDAVAVEGEAKAKRTRTAQPVNVFVFLQDANGNPVDTAGMTTSLVTRDATEALTHGQQNGIYPMAVLVPPKG